jgi:hypothetical protein
VHDFQKKLADLPCFLRLIEMYGSRVMEAGHGLAIVCSLVGFGNRPVESMGRRRATQPPGGPSFVLGLA